jgi:hypothetical protein
MPTDPLRLQSYDIAKGIEFVVLWIMIVFCIALLLSIRAQYRLMNTYDVLNSFNPSKEKRARIMLSHVKRLLFYVLGYQGEERERQSLDQIDEKWILRNFWTILIRFSVFYFIYIWALILTTRALLIDPVSGDIQVINYTSKQIFGFLMIWVYIISNSIFDILSIYFTVKYLEKIRENPRATVAIVHLLKSLSYAFVFFLSSQLISNLIWPLKTNISVSLVDRILSPAIALWPYAFVLDARSSPPQFLHPIFPGQLLITGTVLLPTLVVVLLFIVATASIGVAGILKRYLISQDWVLASVAVTPSPGQKPVILFRWLNAFMTGIASSLTATIIFEWVRHVLAK